MLPGLTDGAPKLPSGFVSGEVPVVEVVACGCSLCGRCTRRSYRDRPAPLEID